MFAITESGQIPETGSKGISKMVFGLVLLACVAAGGAYWIRTHSKPVAVVDPKASEDAVRTADAGWSKAAAARNVDGVVAMYAEDAVVMPPNQELVTGKPAVLKAWTELLAPGTNVSWNPGRVESAASGDLVYDEGYYVSTTTPKAAKGKAAGKPTLDRGKYMAVWRKQPDGSWKVVCDIWNTDLAAKK